MFIRNNNLLGIKNWKDVFDRKQDIDRGMKYGDTILFQLNEANFYSMLDWFNNEPDVIWKSSLGGNSYVPKIVLYQYNGWYIQVFYHNTGFNDLYYDDSFYIKIIRYGE